MRYLVALILLLASPAMAQTPGEMCSGVKAHYIVNVVPVERTRVFIPPTMTSFSLDFNRHPGTQIVKVAMRLGRAPAHYSKDYPAESYVGKRITKWSELRQDVVFSPFGGSTQSASANYLYIRDPSASGQYLYLNVFSGMSNLLHAVYSIQVDVPATKRWCAEQGYQPGQPDNGGTVPVEPPPPYVPPVQDTKQDCEARGGTWREILGAGWCVEGTEPGPEPEPASRFVSVMIDGKYFTSTNAYPVLHDPNALRDIAASVGVVVEIERGVVSLVHDDEIFWSGLIDCYVDPTAAADSPMVEADGADMVLVTQKGRQIIREME